jgi:hypothetical protein
MEQPAATLHHPIKFYYNICCIYLQVNKGEQGLDYQLDGGCHFMTRVSYALV